MARSVISFVIRPEDFSLRRINCIYDNIRYMKREVCVKSLDNGSMLVSVRPISDDMFDNTFPLKLARELVEMREMGIL